MKKKTGFLVSIIILVTSFFSCNTSETREIITNNKFKIQIPKFMRPQKSLNEDASMAYINGIRELYIMVIEDPFEGIAQLIKENDWENDYAVDLEGFTQIICMNEGELFLTPRDYNQLQDCNMNGLDAKLYENSRMINGVNVYYKIALIEGKDTYYQVIAWTLADRKNKNKEIISHMVHSFEEL